jgi:hypothetical protein
MHRRRLTFQLTPLLDLLLIVIFAQYMEMRQSASRVESEVQREANRMVASAVADREAMADQLAAVRNDYAERMRRAEQDREQFKSELEIRLSDATEELQQALTQRKEVADLLAALFQIPKETIEQVLSQEDRSPEEKEQLRALYRQLATERTNEAIKHLLTHRAMRKRVDVWEITVLPQGEILFQAGDQEFRFRFGRTPTQIAEELKGLPVEQQVTKLQEIEEQAAAEFAGKLFDIYRALPQVKDMVVVLFSYKPGAELHWRKTAEAGLERALRLMYGNQDGTQFVPAILGLEVES